MLNVDAKALKDALLKRYDKQIRPVIRYNESVEIKLGLNLYQILEVVKINSS